MVKDDGGTAFPVTRPAPHVGMTLRDYFAGQVLANAAIAPYIDQGSQVSRLAYTIADAMLAERQK